MVKMTVQNFSPILPTAIFRDSPGWMLSASRTFPSQITQASTKEIPCLARLILFEGSAY
jgi:hypothetical protein